MAEPGTRSSLAALALAILLAVPAAADHVPLGPQEPSAQEQEGVWLLNRARHDPVAYGDEIGLDLTGTVPRHPLAVSLELTGAARFHAGEMLGHDYFAHTSPVSGDGPNQMAVDHGYDLFGMGLGMDWGTDNNIESIAFGFNLLPDSADALELLIIDDGVVPPGHRIHLLATSTFYEDHVEVGFGRVAGGASRYYAIHTGWQSPGDLFVTGVVYRDSDGDGEYDRGEGLGGVTVDVGGTQTTTLAEGGYAVLVGPGSHVVSCSGGPFAGESVAVADVVASNVEVDCIEGVPLAEVDFAFQTGAGPALLDVDFTTSTDQGPAPINANLAALGGSPGTVWLWDFGDGTGASGVNANHTWMAPGLYPVVLRGIDAAGTGSALHLVSVEGPSGAGPGTTPPADATLVPTKIKAKRNLKKSGKDSVQLVAELEMPAGYTPGGQTVEVFLAGATLSFTLDEKGKAKDENKNKVKLKAKGDVPLAAGVVAKLSVKLKGDLATALEAAGMRDATEERLLSDVPVAFLLNELVYRGSADLASKAKEGKKATAKIAAP